MGIERARSLSAGGQANERLRRLHGDASGPPRSAQYSRLAIVCFLFNQNKQATAGEGCHAGGA